MKIASLPSRAVVLEFGVKPFVSIGAHYDGEVDGVSQYSNAEPQNGDSNYKGVVFSPILAPIPNFIQIR